MIDKIIAQLVSNHTLSMITLALALILTVLLFHLAWARIIPWRYTILPGLLSAETAIFYFVVIYIVAPTSPSFVVTFYSGIIRIQVYAAAIVFLIVYWRDWRRKQRNG